MGLEHLPRQHNNAPRKERVMTNEATIQELREAVEQLIRRRAEVDIADNRIPPFSPQLRRQKRELQALSLDLLASRNALQSVIREREAAGAGIPPLSPGAVQDFTLALGRLNQVIQADQTFDVIVAAARGIVSASERI